MSVRYRCLLIIPLVWGLGACSNTPAKPHPQEQALDQSIKELETAELNAVEQISEKPPAAPAKKTKKSKKAKPNRLKKKKNA